MLLRIKILKLQGIHTFCKKKKIFSALKKKEKHNHSTTFTDHHVDQFPYLTGVFYFSHVICQKREKNFWENISVKYKEIRLPLLPLCNYKHLTWARLLNRFSSFIYWFIPLFPALSYDIFSFSTHYDHCTFMGMGMLDLCTTCLSKVTAGRVSQPGLTNAFVVSPSFLSSSSGQNFFLLFYFYLRKYTNCERVSYRSKMKPLLFVTETIICFVFLTRSTNRLEMESANFKISFWFSFCCNKTLYYLPIVEK